MTRVFVAEAVLDGLRASAERSRPHETGGILVGVLRDGEPWITSAVEVRDLGRTSSRYVIPAGATPAAVSAAQAADGRVGYIGDWHSHPADVEASATDRGTLARNSRRRSRTKGVPTVMFVVRDTADGWVVDALAAGDSGSMSAEIVETGPLGPEQEGI